MNRLHVGQMLNTDGDPDQLVFEVEEKLAELSITAFQWIKVYLGEDENATIDLWLDFAQEEDCELFVEKGKWW